jgi:hypothetical protein
LSATILIAARQVSLPFFAQFVKAATAALRSGAIQKLQ